MNIRIITNFKFSVSSIQYSSSGELHITLTDVENCTCSQQYEYAASLGDGAASEKRKTSLLEYARGYMERSDTKAKTKDSYRHMILHLERYGDMAVEEIATEYLQGFIAHMQSAGLSAGTVRLYFQKLACVLHDAYKNTVFDYRILQRVKRPKKERERKGFLTVTELRKLEKSRAYGKAGKHGCEETNIERMFLFSCLTGLRFGDIAGLKWENVKKSGKHLYLDFRQQKTGTAERLPLCAGAEEMLRGLGRGKGHVFGSESNQRVNVVLKRWCKVAGIKKDITFHSARHTFCVLLLTEGVPIYTVQHLMGHGDIGTTKVYADITGKAKSKAVRHLPKLRA